MPGYTSYMSINITNCKKKKLPQNVNFVIDCLTELIVGDKTYFLLEICLIEL